MRSFAERSPETEWMDGADVGEAEFAACLADLARVNTVTMARPPTLRFLDQATRGLIAGRPLTILDVGFGEGDMLRAIHRWAAGRGRSVRLVGIDLNPRSAPAARAATPPDWDIDYRTGDLFALPEDEPFDLIISSLVTHHMDDGEIVRFLRWMEARARLGWFINDLHRHAVAFYGFTALSTLLHWHPFVRHDGPISVARSFRRSDWETLLALAGLAPSAARIRWRLPFRYCVERMA